MTIPAIAIPRPVTRPAFRLISLNARYPSTSATIDPNPYIQIKLHTRLAIAKPLVLEYATVCTGNNDAGA